jgi:hypothetical protein
MTFGAQFKMAGHLAGSHRFVREYPRWLIVQLALWATSLGFGITAIFRGTGFAIVALVSGAIVGLLAIFFVPAWRQVGEQGFEA